MKLSRIRNRSQRWVLSILIPAFALSGQPLRANPTGGVVVHGQATIDALSSTHLQINQQSQATIINWTDFSIDVGEITQFVQPNAGAVALNRVVGGNVSQIHGQLQANGNVFVINTNGIFIGSTGVVDIGGNLVLSTLDIDDQDFLSGGPSRFYGDSQTGISNFGTISSAGGDVVLLGGFVDNEGQIGALNGTVALGSGGEILLEQSNGAQITVRGSSDYTGNGVNNAGEVTGASVEMKAHGNVYALAINNTGMVRASGATRANGRVRLQASGASSNINLGSTSQLYARDGGDGGSIAVESVGGSVTNNGLVDASGGLNGGDIAVVGRSVDMGESSVVTATGLKSGGFVQVDSESQTNVSGLVSANSAAGSGGRVEITGDEVEVSGVADISADGAFRGGQLRIGGEFQGRDWGVREATSTVIGSEASLSADSLMGNAGSVIVWANEDTLFLGDASASALSESGTGDGGLVEISGAVNLSMRGSVAANSVNGAAGTVLFDPGTLTVGNFGGTSINANEIEIALINDTLQNGSSVILLTEGVGSDIIFDQVNLGNGQQEGAGVYVGALTGLVAATDVPDYSLPYDHPNHPRNLAIQWTNSDASFAAFAGGSIVVNNHIRTSGAGSINLIAGWTGTETDAILNRFDALLPPPDDQTVFGFNAETGIAGLTPQQLFNSYVANGQFGENFGDILVGNASLNQHVEVGSRYGDTNLAANNIFVTAPNTYNGESAHVQIGFRDAGNVFSARHDNIDNDLDLDLNDGALMFDERIGITTYQLDAGGDNQFVVSDADADTLAAALDVATLAGEELKVELNGGADSLASRTWVIDSVDTGNDLFTVRYTDANLNVGIRLQNANFVEPANRTSLTQYPNEVRIFKDDKAVVAIAGDAFGQEVDMNGDGLVDGVRAIDETGVLGDTFVPYANHFNSSRAGNWWWQQIHEASIIDPTIDTNLSGGYVASYAANVTATTEFGGNRPEMGAGAIGDTADINLIAKGDIEIVSGGRQYAGAYIGHGGDSAGWSDMQSIRDQRTLQFGNQTPGYISVNGAWNGQSSVSIGRLEGVYGNINVAAGVVDVTSIDRDGGLAVDLGTQGNVLVEGLQRLASANGLPINNGSNPEQNSAESTPAQIGHGGVGQFGVFEGDIQVLAAGNVQLNGGSQSSSSAVIGHSVNGRSYWNPTDNADQQLRFFSSAEDFDDPHLRRGILFSDAQTNVVGSGYSQDTLQVDLIGPPVVAHRAVALSDSAASTRQATVASTVGAVEALDGSVVKGFHGDITVTTNTGNIEVNAYSTEDISTDAIGTDGYATARDRRFAQIGHGGSTDSTWSEGSGFADNRSDRRNELVGYRVINGDGGTVGQSGSISHIGELGYGFNRALTFMTITGDITVDSGGNIKVEGGNNTYDYAMIGHGGNSLADFETSSFIIGDIDVDAAGTLEVIGGGQTKYTGNANMDHRSQAMIGHGGFQSGFMALYGDIDVDTMGDITLLGGAYSFNDARIGHGGADNPAQVGGNLSREEIFAFDSAETGVTVNVSGNSAKVTYVANNGTGLAMAEREFEITTKLTNTSNAADVEVQSEGAITLSHIGEGLWRNANQGTTNTSSIDSVSVQIGHGGSGTRSSGQRNRNSQNADGHGVATLFRANSGNNYGDKVGDVTVIANGGDITMQNGNGLERWTRIGHGVGRFGRGDIGGESVEFAGVIVVDASGNIVVDASFASEYGNRLNTFDTLNLVQSEVSQPSDYNPVAIGHGGVIDNNGLIVLDSGTINGLTADSDIRVYAGGNLDLRGGKGLTGSFAQVGHGFSDTIGDSNANQKGGLANGFAGDILVDIGGNLNVKASDQAFILSLEAGITPDLAVSTVGGYATIGHGGLSVDATASGDISVYVQGNAAITATNRTDGGRFDTSTQANQAIAAHTEAGLYRYVPPTTDVDFIGDPDNIASLFNFAKIGHTNAENGNRGNAGAFNDEVNNAGQSGDINVVVANDLTMTGGTTNNVFDALVVGAFSQIGHGGPGISGTGFSGEINVSVGNNLTTTGGIEAANSILPLNNYTKIGHGDYVEFEATAGSDSVFYSQSVGTRSGDINIAVGNNAAFTNTLIGHLDQAENVGASNAGIQSSAGATRVAVSRNNPFYGGTGTLTSTGSVFSSGGSGSDELEFYMPGRYSNNIDGTTRINESGTQFNPGTVLGEFVGLDGSGLNTTGEDDEVYLTPDLWWDDAALALANGVAGGAGFPTDGVSAQGGAIAAVDTPGGFPNLQTLTAGALGSSATLYRGGNNVNGSGNYTFYYDAVELTATASLPGPPPAGPFPFIDFVFNEQFDSFARYQELLNNEMAGEQSSIFAVLGLFETDESETEPSGAMRVENRLDNMFGPRKDSYSREELDEENKRNRDRGRRGVGAIGLTYYVFDPGTNRYSSYRVFGGAAGQFYPVN